MKRVLCLIICVVFGFMSACSPYKEINQDKRLEILDSGKYYCIYKENITKVLYVIYNSNGEVVLSEETGRPLKINMLNDDIVDIEIGLGTGLSKHTYYSVSKDVFSQEFTYVLASFHEMISYIDVSFEKPFENRRVIVQNIFDKSLFYEEYQLNFSKIDTPVIQAEFLENATLLQLIYLCGESQVETSITLNLSK